MPVSALETYQNLGLAPVKDNVIEAKKQELGQNEFLLLMTTQLTHQDPNKPMENGDFLAQMAQFSTVEGISNLNDSFSEFTNSISSGQALQAAALVGQSVLVPSSEGLLSVTDNLSGEVILNERADSVNVDFLDPNGQVVKILRLGAQDEGTVKFEWDGLLDDGTYADPGVYSMRVEASIEGGNTAFQTYVTAKVESVSLGGENGTVSLALSGLGDVNFNQIKKIF